MGWYYYLPDLTICTYLPYLRRYLKVLGRYSGGELGGWNAPKSRVAGCSCFTADVSTPPSSSPTGKNEAEVLRHGAAAECQTRTTRRRGES